MTAAKVNIPKRKVSIPKRTPFKKTAGEKTDIPEFIGYLNVEGCSPANIQEKYGGNYCKYIRRRLGMTRVAFCRTYCVPISTVREWEGGRTAPSAAGIVLLAAIDKDPQVVADLVTSTGISPEPSWYDNTR